MISLPPESDDGVSRSQTRPDKQRSHVLLETLRAHGPVSGAVSYSASEEKLEVMNRNNKGFRDMRPIHNNISCLKMS